MQTAWFPEPSRTAAERHRTGYFSTGPVNIGLPHVIAIGLIIAVWLFNFFGTRSPWRSTTWPGSCSCSRSSVFTFLPFINGDFDTDNLTYS